MSRLKWLTPVLFSGFLVAVPTSTQADYSMICSGYTSCANAGRSHFGYPDNDHKSYWAMYTGRNCTNYVAYRLITTNGMSTTRPKPGVGNARDWGVAMAEITDQTPAVGSVAWWGRPSGGNHVAYVEEVISPTEIIVSESNWGSDFSWRRITKPGRGWPDGFIHFADTEPQVESQPMEWTTEPELDQVPRAGQEIGVITGALSPEPQSPQYSYQWLLDGSPIAGATAATFTPTEAMTGEQLSVEVAATATGFEAAPIETEDFQVAPSRLTATFLPAILGTPIAGSTLQAFPGLWTPYTTQFSYQWLADGVPISGATATTYRATTADVGRLLEVRVTARLADFPVATTSSIPFPAIRPAS